MSNSTSKYTILHTNKARNKYKHYLWWPVDVLFLETLTTYLVKMNCKIWQVVRTMFQDTLTTIDYCYSFD